MIERVLVVFNVMIFMIRVGLGSSFDKVVDFRLRYMEHVIYQ